ncbi:MAG: Tetratricopeptide repeat protein [Acidobacteriales bacterium]|nr:Tetratricopeptide repeat protein [Terriglobales bacterium]
MSRVPFATLLIALLASLPLLAQKSTVKPMDHMVTDTAIQAPEQLRRVPPPASDLNPAELESKGDLFRAEKNYADALDYYRAAIAKHETAALQNKTGITQLQMLRYDDAKKSFERSIKLDGKYADALNNLGVIYYVKKDYRRAVKNYNKAIKVRDDSASYHSNLGTALFAREEFAKAAHEYTLAMEIDPEVFDHQSANGISAKLGSPQNRAKYNYVIAKTFASRGDTDRCLLYLRKALEDGFTAINDVYKEAEFSSVRKDPRFVALMESKPLGIN